MKPIVKLGAARIRAVDHRHKGGMPYFSATLVSFPIKEAPACPTMAMSEKGVIYFNPDFVSSCEVPQLATFLLHEALHFIRDHAKRGKAVGAFNNRNLAHLWNLACDMEINDDLRDAGCALPTDFQIIFPDTYKFDKGLLAEGYYRLLLDEQEQGSGEGGEGSGEGGEGEGGEGEGAGVGNGESGDGEGGGKGKIMAGNCGSVAGNKGDWEDDETEETLGRTESSADAIRQAAAIAVDQAAKDPSTGRGTVPDGLARWASDRLGPSKIPWQTLLAMALRRAMVWSRGKVNYTFKRQSRRQASLGMGHGCPIIPGMRRPVPDVWGVIDTSGSMGMDELGDAMRETKAVMDATGGDLSFVTCDAQIHGLQKIKSFEEAKRLLKGGGGTSFVPIFEAYDKAQRKPHVIIVFTDGGGDAPADAPQGVKVIWCLVGKHQQKPFVSGDYGRSIDWGDFIEVEPEEQK